MVAGAPVPCLGKRCGAELHHAERHVGADKHVAVVAGADQWIHMVDGARHEFVVQFVVSFGGYGGVRYAE